MALRSHLEQPEQLNSFGSRSHHAGQPVGLPAQEGIGDSPAPANDMRRMAFLEQLDKSHPAHLQRLEAAAEESNLSYAASSSCRRAAPAPWPTARSVVWGEKWFVTTLNKEQRAPIPLPLPRTRTFLISACESSVVLCLVVTVW